ncbi:PRC-barrel domain protein [Rubellimicrobium thermophilum DSM 16684]|uniref:PRC-barrel domain protein n=1 Tax=Rubellimicrobium thermophilum DSM 16684 TaxID=1123069 RepID=S9QNY2_9RHOB|nr:PRC-barrel domain-containing protein [Rubellimicrobium thermophilum]EPX83111.1 PRC-barrel domain protein [Rubellimicrobium thermophilum DSM 16684]
MKRLLLSTALFGALAMPALAQTLFRTQMDPMEIRASEFMGMRVYASEAALDADEFPGIQEGWDDIGEVADVILSRDGTVQAVLVDIGGFLGIGERRVAINMDQLRFVADSATAEDLDDFFLVVNTTREALEGAPDYDAGMSAEAAAAATGEAIAQGAETAATSVAAAGAEMADTLQDAGEEVAEEVNQLGMTDHQENMAEAQDQAMDAAEESAEAAGADSMTTDPAGAPAPMAFERDGFVPAMSEDLTSERLTGVTAYDINDERVGTVADLILDDSGQVTHVVVDVGGFLGIGAKPVALDLSQVAILRADGGDELRVYLPQTREELDAMERYEAVQ